MNPLQLAWLNLVRHKTATSLVLISLAITVACAGVLLRTWKLAEARFDTMVHAGDALVAAKGNPVESLLGAMNLEGPYPGFIPARLYGTLVNEAWIAERENFRARSVVPLVFCGKYRDYRVIGTSSAFLEQPEPAPDIALAAGAWPEIHAGVILGADIAKSGKLSLGDSVEIVPWTADSVPVDAPPARRMEVSGVLAPMGNAWDRAVFTNLAQSRKLVSGGLAEAGERTHWKGFVLHYVLLHIDPPALKHFEELIDRATVAQLVPYRKTLASLENLTATGRAAGLAVSMLALLLAAAALMAVMLGRFDGLSRQMAVLEAMGFRRRELMSILAWEGVILGMGATILGGILDATLFPLLQGFLADALPGREIAVSRVWESRTVWLAAVLILPAASMASALFIFRGHAMQRLRSLS